jgi:hypothetical protein
MATLAALRTRVAKIVDDEDFLEDIPVFLNQGVQEIAGGMQSAVGDYITPPLPDLFSIGTVTTVTDAAYVAMPATFQRSLVAAVDEDGTELDIAHSWQEFIEAQPLLDRSGRIYEVVEQGGNLYYQGIPTAAETVTVHFYRKPVDMSSDTSVPDGIPTHLQDPLLVNFACYKIFELIEDGIEGPGVNTQRYEKRFLQALKTLEMTIPRDTRSLFLGD